jgi:hypothetical protein
MRQLLSISFAALIMLSCQSSAKKNESETNQVPVSAPLNSAETGQRPTHNPAHGMPYHDCALEVGAPLAAEQAVPTLPKANEKPAEKSPVKLNPAHGQPGHSCDVEVGATLT